MLNCTTVKPSETQRIGLVVFAHGSSEQEANEAVKKVAEKTAVLCGLELWSQAFLDPIQPNLGTAVGILSRQGAQKIVIVPYFLTMGVHIQKDLPNIIEEISKVYPSIQIVCAPSLDGDPFLVDILVRRARKVLQM